jgi:hypothetical protein
MNLIALAVSYCLVLCTLYVYLIWQFYHRPPDKTMTVYQWDDGTLRAWKQPEELKNVPRAEPAPQLKELTTLTQRLDKFEADLSIFRGALKAMAGLEKQIKDYLRKRKAKK